MDAVCLKSECVACFNLVLLLLVSLPAMYTPSLPFVIVVKFSGIYDTNCKECHPLSVFIGIVILYTYTDFFNVFVTCCVNCVFVREHRITDFKNYVDYQTFEVIKNCGSSVRGY